MLRLPSPPVRFALVLLGLASFTACETRHTEPPQRTSAGGEVVGSERGATGADTARGVDTTQLRNPASETSAARPGATPAGAAGTITLTVPHVFGMFDDANSTEISAAGLAVERGTNAAVKNFATQLIRDHRQLLHESRTLSARLGVTPQATNDSTLVELETQLLDTLRATPRGPSFDRVFIADQIRLHQKAISAVRTAEQATQESQLRGLLQNAVTVLESHLHEAERIQQRLSS